MTHWLTVHHPPEIGAEGDGSTSGVWVRKKDAHRFRELEVGDQVLIYETRSGPARWLDFPDGTRRRSEYQPGRMAVVAVGRVIEVTSHQPVTVARQDDGEEISWARLAIPSVEPLAHPVPRARVNALLGLQATAVFRGFGGFRKVTEAQFRAIVEAGQ